MTLTPGEYLELSVLKAVLRDVRTDPNPFDDAYRMAIRAASAQIDEHCNQRFWRTDPATAVTFRAEDVHTLWTGPFADTTDMVVALDQDDDGVFETVLGAGDWQAGPGNRLPGRPFDHITLLGGLRFPGAWRGDPWRYQYNLRLASWRGQRDRVQVTAHWGWPEIPWQVTQACQILAIDHFKSKDMTGASAGTPMTAAGSFGAQASHRVSSSAFNSRAAALLCGLRDYVIA